ncbi:unnamed protein product [Nippostrongylus brasiliensis]|uniref:N-acetyltransferase domain-containing protein n=1 Tax=Nippostrongylus brasiliensis TaxID=27835 RepID=A0A0N4Y1U3_NIPBR|nr:unnamed protein product [Nippostrongylus brasiliensis]
MPTDGGNLCKSSDVTFVTATDQQRADIIEFLHKEFIRNEPMAASLKITKGPYKNRNENRIATFLDVAEAHQDELLGKDAKIFKIEIICVAVSARGLGIAKELMRLSLEKARSEGCDWMAAVATAVASQSLFAKVVGYPSAKLPNFADFGQSIQDGGMRHSQRLRHFAGGHTWISFNYVAECFQVYLDWSTRPLGVFEVVISFFDESEPICYSPVRDITFTIQSLQLTMGVGR